ncbi:DoxX family protein [Candidatus Kaiserbacteria bacterium]|nr:DoxX family protein [Candidatus Kaiserbacteria bacterium]
MIKHLTHMRYHKALGLLVLRLATGLVFLNHGWSKLAGLAGARGFFSSLGLPAETATLIAVVEVVGGLMLILGVAPRIAGLVLGAEMIAAMILVGLPASDWMVLFAKPGSVEIELVLAAAALAIFAVGGGRYAIYSAERD